MSDYLRLYLVATISTLIYVFLSYIFAHNDLLGFTFNVVLALTIIIGIPYLFFKNDIVNKEPRFILVAILSILAYSLTYFFITISQSFTSGYLSGIAPYFGGYVVAIFVGVISGELLERWLK